MKIPPRRPRISQKVLSRFNKSTLGPWTYHDNEMMKRRKNLVVSLAQQKQKKINLTSQNGCDSLIYSNVTFNPSYTIGESLYICGGDDYILPDGSIVDEDGVYPVTLSSVNGCDSTIIVDLSFMDLSYGGCCNRFT